MFACTKGEDGEQKKVEENEVIVISSFKTKRVPPLVWQRQRKQVVNQGGRIPDRRLVGERARSCNIGLKKIR